MDVSLAPKWAKFDHLCDKSWTFFLSDFDTFWQGEPKCTEIQDIFICILTEFDPLWRQTTSLLVISRSRSLWRHTCPIHRWPTSQVRTLNVPEIDTNDWVNSGLYSIIRSHFSTFLSTRLWNFIENWSRKDPDSLDMMIIWASSDIGVEREKR